MIFGGSPLRFFSSKEKKGHAARATFGMEAMSYTHSKKPPRVSIKREVSAFILEDGRILVSPWKGPQLDRHGKVIEGFEDVENRYLGNEAISYNNYLRRIPEVKTVLFEGKWHYIFAQIHTHPSATVNSRKADKKAQNESFHFPVFSIDGISYKNRTGTIRDVDGNSFGTVASPSKRIFKK